MILIVSLVGLIFLSAFFSASETGLMGANRYRLKSLSEKGDRGAQRVLKLLTMPEKALSVILLGNTAANLLISSIATILASAYFGPVGIMICTILLTIVVLVFVEITPKTFAAVLPDMVARFASFPLMILLKIMSPLIVVLSSIARMMLRLFGISGMNSNWSEGIAKDELKGVLSSAGSNKFVSEMMMSVLDLDETSVDEVMLSRSAIAGIDVSLPWSKIVEKFTHAHRMRLLVYDKNIDKPLGVVLLSDVVQLISNNQMNRDLFMKLLKPFHFIPTRTPLVLQLRNFQNQNYSLGLVVDEYGEVIGMVSLEDIIEEIIGEYTQSSMLRLDGLKQNADGSYWILGAMNVRDLNRTFSWCLPENGPITINGLVTEYLECIPSGQLCMKINNNRIEVVRIRRNKVELIKLWPSKVHS